MKPAAANHQAALNSATQCSFDFFIILKISSKKYGIGGWGVRPRDLHVLLFLGGDESKFLFPSHSRAFYFQISLHIQEKQSEKLEKGECKHRNGYWEQIWQDYMLNLLWRSQANCRRPSSNLNLWPRLPWTLVYLHTYRLFCVLGNWFLVLYSYSAWNPSLQQWFEYCSSAKKCTCPVCKQSCSPKNVSRLYFQSLGDEIDLTIPQKPRNPELEDPEILRGEVKRLEVKVSRLNSALESQQNELKEINEEVLDNCCYDF